MTPPSLTAINTADGKPLNGRVIEECYAILCANGWIAGDGESDCTYPTREMADRVLCDPALREMLEEGNRCTEFRIAKVVRVEVAE